MSQQRSTRRWPRLAVAPLLVTLALTACGDDDGLDTADVIEEPADTLLTPQLNGLEVTVTGNVSEVVDEHGFQIDKDGLGAEGSAMEDREPGIDFEDDYFDDDYDLYDEYDYDYDYYDYDYYTGIDGEIDEFDERGVLVVTSAGTDVTVDESVQVNGTLRYFDEAELERIYDVEFDDGIYGSYDRQYVIVADGIKTLPRERPGGSAGGEAGSSATTTTMANGASTTTEEQQPSSSTTEGDGTSTTAADGMMATTTTRP